MIKIEMKTKANDNQLSNYNCSALMVIDEIETFDNSHSRHFTTCIVKAIITATRYEMSHYLSLCIRP